MFGPSAPTARLVWPLLTSAPPSQRLSTPVAHHGSSADLPGYDAPTFTLMPVGSTPHHSVQVLGFGNYGYLTPIRRLIRFLFVRPALCLGLPSDPQSPGEPLPLANTSPCRVCRGLSPPSECALPGAPQKKTPAARQGFLLWAWPVWRRPARITRRLAPASRPPASAA
ncbi:hypothetical protein CBM2633_A50728 [Cupriavidus taiwanensis]|nr:hypothetical protein CBM2633_A50728 [Cupriavidus taiwanensis]